MVILFSGSPATSLTGPASSAAHLSWSPRKGSRSAPLGERVFLVERACPAKRLRSAAAPRAWKTPEEIAQRRGVSFSLNALRRSRRTFGHAEIREPFSSCQLQWVRWILARSSPGQPFEESRNRPRRVSARARARDRAAAGAYMIRTATMALALAGLFPLARLRRRRPTDPQIAHIAYTAGQIDIAGKAGAGQVEEPAGAVVRAGNGPRSRGGEQAGAGACRQAQGDAGGQSHEHGSAEAGRAEAPRNGSKAARCSIRPRLCAERGRLPRS